MVKRYGCSCGWSPSEMEAGEFIRLDDLQSNSNDVKSVVIQHGLGLCSLSEPDYLGELERLYWIGFKAGFDKQTALEAECKRLRGELESANERARLLLKREPT